jgi:hypothetical protein
MELSVLELRLLKQSLLHYLAHDYHLEDKEQALEQLLFKVERALPAKVYLDADYK